MGSLGLVLTDIVLIIVALGGGILTLVRARRVGGLAVGLAAAACGLLVLSGIVDMVWWLAIFPGIVESEGYSGITGLHVAASATSWLLIVVSIGLLFASTNVGRSAGADPAGAPAAAPNGVPGAAPAGTYGAPAGFASPAATAPAATAPNGPVAAPTAQPTQGWTPPQQAQPNWNIHSGVWSIPHGTFDGPPPDQRQH